MQSKNLSKWILIILGTVGIISSVIVFSLPRDSSPHRSFVDQKSLPKETGIPFREKVKSGLPVRLKIQLNAFLEKVGLMPDGTLDVPKNISNAAWYNIGPRPGEVGSAVIDGHFGWVNRKPAVFNSLYILHIGDRVYVEDEKGGTIAFVVSKIRTYGENEDAPDVFVSTDGKAHLNIITCQGIWNKVRKSYPNRLVIFTDKAVEEQN